ncbi:hypothetical protein ERX27_10565 [Macrococcus brunensis]|uniref:Polysaccharide biosynthesis protein C-terminal domain-containing protein n=1 Tax=Macrococcus brunensis TaxID=198483 RepID=A0A4V3BD74_9STAP|nr:oligosaccharide flippase family protein [Macrococcus brunensis]TDL93399.1 hypothetical protein ERX27_10565 [Macrococcus brunensis]
MKRLLGFSASTIFVAIINLCSLMILTRLFSPGDYGKANLLISYAVIVSTIISFAVDQVLIHYFYKVNLKSVLINFCKYSFLIVAIIAIILFFIKPVLSFSNLDLILLVLYSVALVINKIFLTLFRMKNDFRNYFIQACFSKIAELALIVALLFSLSESYFILLLPFAISVSLISLFQSRSAYKIINHTTEQHSISLHEQISFSLPLLFSILLTTVTQNIDKITLSHFVSDEKMGVYYTSFKLIGLISIVYTVISLVWVPKAVKISSQETQQDSSFYLASESFLQIICCIIIILYLTFKDLIMMLLGNEFMNSSDLIDILIIIPVVMVISEVYSTYITVNKRTKCHLVIAIMILVINSVCSFTFSMVWGVEGAAYSMFLTYLAIYTLRLYYYQKISSYSLFRFQNITGYMILVILFSHSFIHNRYITIAATLIIFIILSINFKDKSKFFFKSILD